MRLLISCIIQLTVIAALFADTDSDINETANTVEEQNHLFFALPDFGWIKQWLNSTWLSDTGKSLREFGHRVPAECLGDLQRVAKAYAAIAEHLTKESMQLLSVGGNTVSYHNSNNLSQDLWALKMVNSFGSLAPGVSHQGPILMYGSYAQCIETTIPQEQTEIRRTKRKSSRFARYCTLTIRNSYKQVEESGRSTQSSYGPYPQLIYGTCWPSSCVRIGNNVIAEHLSRHLVNAFSAVSNFTLTHRIHCQPSIDDRVGFMAELTSGQLCFLVFSSICLLLTATGTVVDLWPKCWSLCYRKNNVDLEIKRSKTNHRRHDSAEPESSWHCEVESTSSISSLGSTRSINRVISIDLESIISYKSTRSLSEKVKQVNWWKRFLLAFSLCTNVRWLLQTSHNRDHCSERRSNRIKCLFGLKTLTMIWVVVGHAYVFSLPHTSNMPYVVRILPDQILAQIILNGTLSVDTFFLISGLLTAYVCTKRTVNGGVGATIVKWLVFYVHRLVRLLPPYAFVLFFALTWFRRLGHGPRWDTESMPEVRCPSPHSWWQHLTFTINMFDIDPSALCMPWMWYLAADFQMYMISPIFIIILQKFHKTGVCLAIVCIIISSIIQGIWISIHRLPTNMILFLPDEHFDNDVKRHFETVYRKTYFRCGPYLIGLLIGWAFANGRIKPRRCVFALWQKVILLLSAFGFCFWALFGAYPLMNESFNGIYNGIYASLNRTSWSIGIALLIYLCQASRESHLINDILSSKVFWPLSRVTYGNYLSHELLILYTYYNLQNPITFENHRSILVYAAFFVFLSYISAFLLFLLIEGPILSAERLLFRKPNSSIPSSNDVTLISHRQMTEQWVDSLRELEDIAQEYDDINENDQK